MHKNTTLSRPLANRNRINLDIALHESDSNILILNMPGYQEDLNGPHNRYLNLADLLQREEMGNVVRIGNQKYEGLDFSKTMVDNLRFAIDYCSSIKEGSKLHLMGFSAGASAIATVASDYPSIEKILLVAPSGDAGIRYMEGGLRKYSGEAYFTTGEHDELADPDFVRELHDNCYSAKKKQFRVIPNCNHDFTGEDNSRVISKAPFWAFEDDDSFPSPDGGTIIYD